MRGVEEGSGVAHRPSRNPPPGTVSYMLRQKSPSEVLRLLSLAAKKVLSRQRSRSHGPHGRFQRVLNLAFSKYTATLPLAEQRGEPRLATVGFSRSHSIVRYLHLENPARCHVKARSSPQGVRAFVAAKITTCVSNGVLWVYRRSTRILSHPLLSTEGPRRTP